jgi:myo-inositol-1(or 4)-monophosphatase
MPLADIELVKSLVVEAGKTALAQASSAKSEYKADKSLVTDIDRSTEEFLYTALAKEYPGYGFLGEEYGRRGPDAGPLWACDPIDGTTNFVYGLPHWGVSLGLLSEGAAILGAVFLPRFDELYWGVRGQGSYCNGERLQAEDRNDLHVEDTVCLTSNSSKTLNNEAVAGRIRCFGSIAAELVYTARGNLRATVGLHEGIVDIAAALVICKEAGCEFKYLNGPEVSVSELILIKRTMRHFVVAPPILMSHLQSILHVR